MAYTNTTESRLAQVSSWYMYTCMYINVCVRVYVLTIVDVDNITEMQKLHIKTIL
jgi:hypothetical protein